MLDTRNTAHEAVIAYNAKVRTTNLCRDCFDDASYSFEVRLEQFAKAYDLWAEGSMERDRLVRQYPVLANMLRMNRAKVASYD